MERQRSKCTTQSKALSTGNTSVDTSDAVIRTRNASRKHKIRLRYQVALLPGSHQSCYSPSNRTMIRGAPSARLQANTGYQDTPRPSRLSFTANVLPDTFFPSLRSGRIFSLPENYNHQRQRRNFFENVRPKPGIFISE